VPLAVGDSDELRLGDQLIAVGYALDLNGEPSVTSGILSAKNRTIVAENGAQLVNLLQTDTAINPGNSGGPLLNGRGEVVGINTAIAGGAENIGFAIAITPVMNVIDSLRDGSVPDRALMGVTTQPTGEGLGVEVIEIAEGSGAADSSLRVGDVIVTVDNTAITDPTSLGAAIAGYQPGDTVTVTVDRNGSTQDVDVTLGTRPT
jgi:putative serine protease PepD